MSDHTALLAEVDRLRAALDTATEERDQALAEAERLHYARNDVRNQRNALTVARALLNHPEDT